LPPEPAPIAGRRQRHIRKSSNTSGALRPSGSGREFLRAGSTSRYRPWAEGVDQVHDTAKQVTGDRHFGHLEDRVAGVSDDLRADLDHLLAQGR
jgi:hypothetical protein